MQSPRRFRSTKFGGLVAVTTTAVVGLIGLVALSACSNYAEGDRCEQANGNSDCASGLVCRAAAQVNKDYNSSDRCCPAIDSNASHPACIQQQPVFEGGATPPSDTAPPVTQPSPVDGAADAADAATAPSDASGASDADSGR